LTDISLLISKIIPVHGLKAILILVTVRVDDSRAIHSVIQQGFRDDSTTQNRT